MTAAESNKMQEKGWEEGKAPRMQETALELFMSSPFFPNGGTSCTQKALLPMYKNLSTPLRKFSMRVIFPEMAR